MTTCSPNCPVVKQQLRKLVEESPWLKEKYGRKPGQNSTSSPTLQEVATATSATFSKRKKRKKNDQWETTESEKSREQSPYSRDTNESSVSREQSLRGVESRTRYSGNERDKDRQTDKESYLDLQESRSHQSYPGDVRYVDSQHSRTDDSIDLSKSAFSLSEKLSKSSRGSRKVDDSDSEAYTESIQTGKTSFAKSSRDFQKGRVTMEDENAGPSGSRKSGHSESRSQGKKRGRLGTMNEEELCELEEECDFDNVCLCRMHCVIRGMRKYSFVRSMLTAVVLFTIGLKLCAELDAWTLPTGAV